MPLSWHRYFLKRCNIRKFPCFERHNDVWWAVVAELVSDWKEIPFISLSSWHSTNSKLVGISYHLKKAEISRELDIGWCVEVVRVP